jgi:hypothetical protein
MVGAVGLACVAACATVRPYFEADFREGTRASRDSFVRLLATRYGCDTTAAVFNAGKTGLGFLFAPGMTACEAGGFVFVRTIQAWRDSSGVREQWDTPDCVYGFQGATERSVRAYRRWCH